MQSFEEKRRSADSLLIFHINLYDDMNKTSFG